MLKKLKVAACIVFASFLVIGLIAISDSSIQTAKADAKDNLTKASAGVIGGWTETVIYPVQKASEPGWVGKALVPVNIVVGAVKGAAREVAGAADALTFYKGDNIVDSYPGEDL
ncbi:MAG: hypothetical protein ISR98_00795 [Parcubacteria group bacterium]|nr:hypothetical protein [Parcubacteria group bacterium]